MELLLLTRGEHVALLCAATAVLYASPLLLSPSTDWHFLSTYDDYDNFVDNPVLQGDFLFSWQNLLQMATMRRINVYEPLSWLLKAMIVQCVGLDSWAVRVVTVVLHFAAGFVLVRVSVLLIEVNDLLSCEGFHCLDKASERVSEELQAESVSAPPRCPTIQQERKRRQHNQYVLGCCLSALLFLMHPIHVEVVAWPSAQPYALAALFANLSLLFYLQKTRLALQSRRSNDNNVQLITKSASVKHDRLVAGFYLCSVLSKSVTVLLPAAFVFVDTLVLIKLRILINNLKATTTAQELLVTYVSHKASVLLVMLSFIGVTIWSNSEDWEDLLTLSLGQRVVRAVIMPAWTLSHIVWPAKLRMHYQLREEDLELLGNPACLVSILALLLCLLLGLWRFKARNAPHVLLVTLYYLVMMLPTAGLVQHGIVLRGCDRYAYFPSAVFVPFGGYVLGKYLFGDKHGNHDSRTANPECNSPEPYDRKIRVNLSQAEGNVRSPVMSSSLKSSTNVLTWLGFGATLLVSIWLSTSLMVMWRSERSLYEHNLKLDPSDWRMHSWLGNTLANTPSFCVTHDFECRVPWDFAYVFAPRKTLAARRFRAKTLLPLMRFAEACELYEELIQEHADSRPLLNSIGICRFLQGWDVSEAHALLVQAASAPPPGKSGYDIATIKRNLEFFEAWLASFRAEHGYREPTIDERATFTGWIVI